MKTGNTFFAMAIIAILGIIAVVTTCDNDNTTPAPQTFTVTFNANGGSPTPPNQTIEKGKTADEPQGVTKPNTTLGGWYTEAAFATKWNFAADPVTAAITLHAQWLCNCETKAHLGIDENCACGGTDCNCTEQIAFLEGTTEGKSISIHKASDISIAEMNAAVVKINGAYNKDEYGFDASGEKSIFQSKVTKIYVTNGVDITLKGTILEIGVDADEYDIAIAYFMDVVYKE
jgi:hypothetical protein